jgi:hypothetical protein
MSHDAVYFGELAKHCRELAQACRDEVTLKLLLAMADDFDEEARSLDGAGTMLPVPDPPPTSA